MQSISRLTNLISLIPHSLPGPRAAVCCRHFSPHARLQSKMGRTYSANSRLRTASATKSADAVQLAAAEAKVKAGNATFERRARARGRKRGNEPDAAAQHEQASPVDSAGAVDALVGAVCERLQDKEVSAVRDAVAAVTAASRSNTYSSAECEIHGPVALTEDDVEEFQYHTTSDRFENQDGTSRAAGTAGMGSGYLLNLFRSDKTDTVVFKNMYCAAFVTKSKPRPGRVKSRRTTAPVHTVDIVTKHGHRGRQHATKVMTCAVASIVPVLGDTDVRAGEAFANGKIVNPIVEPLVKRVCKRLGLECFINRGTNKKDVGSYSIVYALNIDKVVDAVPSLLQRRADRALTDARMRAAATESLAQQDAAQAATRVVEKGRERTEQIQQQEHERHVREAQEENGDHGTGGDMYESEDEEIRCDSVNASERVDGSESELGHDLRQLVRDGSVSPQQAEAMSASAYADAQGARAGSPATTAGLKRVSWALGVEYREPDSVLPASPPPRSTPPPPRSTPPQQAALDELASGSDSEESLLFTDEDDDETDVAQPPALRRSPKKHASSKLPGVKLAPPRKMITNITMGDFSAPRVQTSVLKVATSTTTTSAAAALGRAEAEPLQDQLIAAFSVVRKLMQIVSRTLTSDKSSQDDKCELTNVIRNELCSILKKLPVSKKLATKLDVYTTDDVQMAMVKSVLSKTFSAHDYVELAASIVGYGCQQKNNGKKCTRFDLCERPATENAHAQVLTTSARWKFKNIIVLLKRCFAGSVNPKHTERNEECGDIGDTTPMQRHAAALTAGLKQTASRLDNNIVLFDRRDHKKMQKDMTEVIAVLRHERKLTSRTYRLLNSRMVKTESYIRLKRDPNFLRPLPYPDAVTLEWLKSYGKVKVNRVKGDGKVMKGDGVAVPILGPRSVLSAVFNFPAYREYFIDDNDRLVDVQDGKVILVRGAHRADGKPFENVNELIRWARLHDIKDIDREQTVNLHRNGPVIKLINAHDTHNEITLDPNSVRALSRRLDDVPRLGLLELQRDCREFGLQIRKGKGMGNKKELKTAVLGALQHKLVCAKLRAAAEGQSNEDDDDEEEIGYCHKLQFDTPEQALIATALINRLKRDGSVTAHPLKCLDIRRVLSLLAPRNYSLSWPAWLSSHAMPARRRAGGDAGEVRPHAPWSLTRARADD